MTVLAVITAETFVPQTRKELQMFNRERVRSFLEKHLGATNKDVGRALNLCPRTVQMHVNAIKDEWRHV